MSTETTPSRRALILSVGGAPAPIAYSLQQHRPDLVWFFCSEDSIETASKIFLETLGLFPDWKLIPEYLVVERFEELGPCYRALRSQMPELMKKWNVAPENVAIDYTGGTKTMSAALVLAAVELFGRFSYVGGMQREKNGTGITIDGKEKMYFQANPWAELAIRKIEKARDLWATYNFDAVADTLDSVARTHPQPLLFKTIARVARGLAERHRLDFASAVRTLGDSQNALGPLFEGKNEGGLLPFVEAAKQLCIACRENPAANTALLHELLDNTLRTAAQNRFEDAAARLYRCMEMQLQIWLTEKTDGHFLSGSCKNPPAVWPAHLRPLEELRPDDFGEIKLGLEKIILTLHSLGDARVAAMATDLDQKHPRLRDIAQIRNNGILAHGTSAVGREGFAKFKTVAAEFFPFDFSCERNPIPPLSSLWLHTD